MKTKATSGGGGGGGEAAASGGVCVGHPGTSLQRCRRIGLSLALLPSPRSPLSTLKLCKAKPRQLPLARDTPPPAACPCLSCLHESYFGSKSRILLERPGRCIPHASPARRSHRHTTNPPELTHRTKHLIRVTVPQCRSCVSVPTVAPAPCLGYAAAVPVPGCRADPVSGLPSSSSDLPHRCKVLWQSGLSPGPGHHHQAHPTPCQRLLACSG